MPARKCTCPECNLTFDAPATAGGVTCPICDTQFAAPTSLQAEAPRAPTRSNFAELPATPATSTGTIRRASRVRSEPVDTPAPGKSNLVGRIVLVAALVFVACGLGMGYYVVSTLRHKAGAAEDQTAQVNNKELPPPVLTAPAASIAPEPRPEPRPQPEPPRPLTEHEKNVNKALDRGVAFLKKEMTDIHQDRLGFKESWQRDGVLALVGLTLLECGVPANDSLIQKTASELRSRSKGFFKTYALSLAVLFFDRLGDPKDRDLIQTCALRLVAGQKQSGCWSYDCISLTPDEEKRLIDFLRSSMYVDPDATNVKRNSSAGLPNKLRNLAVPRWQNGDQASRNSGGDNSNTQFAVLGLWVAQRQGLPMQPALTLVERYFRRVQNDDGSFGYVRGNQWRDSMTCAGLVGLAAGRGAGQASPDGQRTRDTAIERALRFLGTRIDTNAKPQGKKFVAADSLGDLYYLWSLERVAVIFDLDTIAGKDWYGWASKLIVAHQNPDGSWEDTFPGAVDTCFALLVLKRVNVAKDLTSNIKKFVDIKNVR